MVKVEKNFDRKISNILRKLEGKDSSPQASFSGVEAEQVETVYALEDRTWNTIPGDKRVCAMGKLNMKALARTTKEKATGSSLKRKESEFIPTKKMISIKKSRVAVEEARVDPTKNELSSNSALVSAVDKGKDVVQETEAIVKLTSETVDLKGFLDEVTKAFSRSAFDKSNPINSSAKKLQLSFNMAALALYAQYEVFSELESIEGPLKEKVADLIQRLEEAEADLSLVNKLIEKKEIALEKLGASKKEADRVIQVLTSNLEVMKKKNEVEVKKLGDRVSNLHESVDRLTEENEKLKVGEGLDLEVIIDSPAFAIIKDHIEDSTGDELIRRIQEVYPDLDLAFLTDGGIDSFDVVTKKTGVDAGFDTASIELEVMKKKNEVEVEKLGDRVSKLQESVDRLMEENEKLKAGEGLDREVIIDSPAFEIIKDHIEDSTGDELVRRIQEVYPDLDLAFLTDGGIDSSDAVSKKIGADARVDPASIELEVMKKKNEVEVKKLGVRVSNLQESVDRLTEENEKLKAGDGLDLEVIIDSPNFAIIKDHIEDSTGDELVRRIQEVYPNLDLAFLTNGGIDSLDAIAKKIGADAGIDQASIELEINSNPSLIRSLKGQHDDP